MDTFKTKCIRDCADVELINENRNTISQLSDQFKNVSSILNLTGNSTRLKILHILYIDQKICVCDLSDILNISISAVSQQLKKLKNGNLIESRKEAQTIYYSINSNSKKVVEHIFILFDMTLESTLKK